MLPKWMIATWIAAFAFLAWLDWIDYNRTAVFLGNTALTVFIVYAVYTRRNEA